MTYEPNIILLTQDLFAQWHFYYLSNTCLLQQAFFLFFFFCQWSGNEMLISVNQNGAQDHAFNNSLSSYNIYFKLLGITYKANHSLASTHYFNHIFLLYQKSTVLHITFVPPIPNILSDNKQPRFQVFSNMNYLFLIHGSVHYLWLSWMWLGSDDFRLV